MNIFCLPSFLLRPARFIWKLLRHIKPLHDFVELQVIYPRLPHVGLLPKGGGSEKSPTLIAGFFSSGHGIGESARLELQAMRNAGREVVGVDIGPAFDLVDVAYDSSVVSREMAPTTGPLLLWCNAPETGRALQFLGKNLTTNRSIIGYWAWELEAEPHHWHKAYAYIDELWVPSCFTAKAFANAPVPVKVEPYKVKTVADAGHSFTELGLAQCEGRYVFLTMADCRSDLVRKNPRGAARAFGQALGNDKRAALVVKLHHADKSTLELELLRKECKQWDNVFLIDRMYSIAERNSLLHRSNTIVSLHRAEGYGLPCAEALMLNKQIIATAYGGPMDFLNTLNSTLVPYTMINVNGETVNYNKYDAELWAEPDLQFSSDAMKQLVAPTR